MYIILCFFVMQDNCRICEYPPLPQKFCLILSRLPASVAIRIRVHLFEINCVILDLRSSLLLHVFLPNTYKCTDYLVHLSLALGGRFPR
jgi:hypothetical protein